MICGCVLVGPVCVCSVNYEVYNIDVAHIFLQNKKERKKVREVGILKKDPEQLREQIQKLEVMSKLIFACVPLSFFKFRWFNC